MQPLSTRISGHRQLSLRFPLFSLVLLATALGSGAVTSAQSTCARWYGISYTGTVSLVGNGSGTYSGTYFGADSSVVVTYSIQESVSGSVVLTPLPLYSGDVGPLNGSVIFNLNESSSASIYDPSFPHFTVQMPGSGPTSTTIGLGIDTNSCTYSISFDDGGISTQTTATYFPQDLPPYTQTVQSIVAWGPTSGVNVTLDLPATGNVLSGSQPFDSGAAANFALAPLNWTFSWNLSPIAGTCPANASTVFPVAGGNKSSNGFPTAMLATFSPSTADAPTTLMAVANDCNVAGFDWQQIVTNLPIPFEDDDGNPLSVPFNDPPAAGYTYMVKDPIDYASFLPPDQTFPFYYNPTIVPNGCAIGLGKGVCSLPITSSNGQTLNFFDSPWNVGLPAGGHIGFTTRLVGVQKGDAVGKTFFEWTWISTYTGPPPIGGNTGGVQIVQTASSLPVDGSGTGGVTIISINGVPQTGDINGDGVVNCADLDIVKASFGKKAGQSGFDMRADVNDDGVVNILDLSYVAKQLPAGTVCR
jgi:hypothetical protein